MSYITPEEAKLIYGSIDEDQVGSTAGFVIEQLEEHSGKFYRCGCAECTESAQWAHATGICLTAGRRFQHPTAQHEMAQNLARTKRALLHLAAQGALNELLRRLEEAEKHNRASMPHQPKI